MIAMPQATAALYIQKFTKYLLNFFSKNLLTVCEIFSKLKLSKFIENISTLESFGGFLLIVRQTISLTLETNNHETGYDRKQSTIKPETIMNSNFYIFFPKF